MQKVIDDKREHWHGRLFCEYQAQECPFSQMQRASPLYSDLGKKREVGGRARTNEQNKHGS